MVNFNLIKIFVQTFITFSFFSSIKFKRILKTIKESNERRRMLLYSLSYFTERKKAKLMRIKIARLISLVFRAISAKFIYYIFVFNYAI